MRGRAIGQVQADDMAFGIEIHIVIAAVPASGIVDQIGIGYRFRPGNVADRSRRKTGLRHHYARQTNRYREQYGQEKLPGLQPDDARDAFHAPTIKPKR